MLPPIHPAQRSDDVAIPRMGLLTGGEKKDLEDIQGLISVDRSSKATQPLTIPRPIQVVYKGSSPRNRQVWYRRQPDGNC